MHHVRWRAPPGGADPPRIIVPHLFYREAGRECGQSLGQKDATTLLCGKSFPANLRLGRGPLVPNLAAPWAEVGVFGCVPRGIGPRMTP